MPRYGFPKSLRLRRRREYLYAQQTGRRLSTPHFTFLLAYGTGEVARLGVTASRHVGNAVVRNRAKRLVREAFRQRPGLLRGGCNLVVIVRAGASSLSLAAVLEEWSRVTSRLEQTAARVRASPPK